VPAQHHDDGAPGTMRRGDRGDDATKVAGDEDVGERIDERAEGTVGAGRARELAGRDLVRASRDGDGADLGEVGLGRATRAAGRVA